MVGDAEDRDPDPTQVLLDVGLHAPRVDLRQPVGSGVRDVRPQERELGLLEDALEDRAPIVELVVAQGHRVVAKGVHDRDHRVGPERRRKCGPVAGEPGEGRLEVGHHRVALDRITAVEQQRALRVVEPLLLDQGRQLGHPGEVALGKVAVGIVVVEDRDRDDRAAVRGVRPIPDDPTIERAVAVGTLVGRRGGPVVGRHVGVDRVEHVAPVRDVRHVLEAGVAVAARRGEELIRADPVRLVQVDRVARLRLLVDDAVVEGAPRIRLRARVGVPVPVVPELEPGRLDDAVADEWRLVEDLDDLGAGHVPDHRRIAERQDREHVAVGQERRLVGACGAARVDPCRPVVAPIGPDPTGVVEEDIDVVLLVAVAVQVVVDGVVDERPHHVVALGRQGRPDGDLAATEVDRAVADRGVHEPLVGWVTRVARDQRVDRGVLGAGRIDDQALPRDRHRLGGRIECQRRVSDAAPVVVGLDDGRVADLGVGGREGRRHRRAGQRAEVRVGVAADDERHRLIGIDQLLGERLVAVDRDAVAVAAIVVAEVAEHDDDVGLRLHLVVVVQDRVRRVLEA